MNVAKEFTKATRLSHFSSFQSSCSNFISEAAAEDWNGYGLRMLRNLPEQVICSAASFMLCCLVMCAFLNCRRMAISNTFVLYTYTCICICVYEWNLTCKRLRLLSAGEEDQNAYDINKLRKPLQDTFMCVPSSPTNIQISDTDTREGGHFDGSIEYARM